MKNYLVVGFLSVLLLGCSSNEQTIDLSVEECAQLGGKKTSNGCETPMSDADCKKLGGSLQNGDCVVE